MHSQSASVIAHGRMERVAAMSTDARVALTARLAEEGLALYMSMHGLDRPTAVARIKATRRLGRRPSACAEAE